MLWDETNQFGWENLSNSNKETSLIIKTKFKLSRVSNALSLLHLKYPEAFYVRFFCQGRGLKLNSRPV